MWAWLAKQDNSLRLLAGERAATISYTKEKKKSEKI